MKKKLLALTIVVAIALLGIFVFQHQKPTVQEGAKTIHIKIENRDTNETLFDDMVKTDALTLEELLLEKEEVKAVFSEDRTYGAFIVSMMDQAQGANNQAPWWMFESENNETCKLEGFCPSSDNVPINDQDSFTFYLTSSF